MKTLFSILTLVLALSTPAATTWTPTSIGVKATCTTGSESAPTLVTQGVSLEQGAPGTGVRAAKTVTVHAETSGTMTVNGLLLAYLWNPVGGGSGTGQWNPAPDLNLTVSALASQGFPGIVIPGPVGRIAFVPSGVGLAVTIFIDVTN